MLAGVEHLKHGPSVGIERQPIVELHLSGQPGVISGHPVQKVRAFLLHHGDALALTLVEDGRIGHAGDDAAPQLGVVLFHLADHPRLFHRVRHRAHVRPLAAVQFPDAVQPPFLVGRIPAHRERLRVAEIVPAPDAPMGRDAERMDHMGPSLVVVVLGVVPPLGEHLPRKAVPVAVEQGFFLRFRQRRQRAQISRVVFQQRLVVEYGRWDENAGAPLDDLPAIRRRGRYQLHHPCPGRGRCDEPCLHPAVADAAGVGRGAGINAGPGSIRAVSAQKITVFLPCEVGQLVEADKVVSFALIVVAVCLMLHRAEDDLRPAWEGPCVGAGVVPRFRKNRLVIPHGLVNQLGQLWERFPDDESPVVRDIHLTQSFDHQRVALSAARCPAVQHLVFGALHEPRLCWLRGPDHRSAVMSPLCHPPTPPRVFAPSRWPL